MLGLVGGLVVLPTARLTAGDDDDDDDVCVVVEEGVVVVVWWWDKEGDGEDGGEG